MGTTEPQRDCWLTVWAHRERLLRIACTRLADPAEAEDVVSEAVLRGACQGYHDAANLGAWLTTVTVNLCYESYRERARAERWRTAVLPERDAHADDALWDWVCVRRTLHRLPDRQRVAVELRAGGFDVPAIAQRLDCTYKTAESLLSRARASLRASVREQV